MGKNDWKSQQVLANEIGVTIQVMHNWVQRKSKKIKIKKDENTGLTLVKLVVAKK